MSGRLCYVESLSDATDFCFGSIDNTSASSSFVFMLPQTNIDRDFFSEWVDKYNISALIIVSDNIVDSSYIFKKPKIISLIDVRQAFEIRQAINKLD